MKKIFLFFLILCTLMTSGCEQTNEIENNTVVTACFAHNNGNEIIYSFYVSMPSGRQGGEDSGSKSFSKVYNFNEQNFGDAVCQFEKSGANRVDFTHLSLFAGNEKYYEISLKNDENYVRKYITSSSLVYTVVYEDNPYEIIKCITDEYNSKPEDFVKNVFSANITPLALTMSELGLSVNNLFYTASVPYLTIKNHGDGNLPEVTSVLLYSSEKNSIKINGEDFNSYYKWRKNYKFISEGYKIKIKNNKITVDINDKFIVSLCQKLAQDDIDVLNVMYYAKKCFLTYYNYFEFMTKYKLSDTYFTGDSV